MMRSLLGVAALSLWALGACHDGAGAAVHIGFSRYSDPLGLESQLAGAATPAAGVAATPGGGAAAQLELMRRMQSQQRIFQLQSEMLRMNHDTSMTIINNMGGGAPVTYDRYDANGNYQGNW